MSESDFKREFWIAKSIGDLLAAAPRLNGSPLREHLRANLSACIESATFGNLLAFADITRTSRGALRYWVSGTHRPQIGALLRMCYQIGVPVTQLLGDPAGTDFDIAPLRNDRGIQSRRRGAEVRLALDRALAEEPPPSVSDLARRLHFARSERLYQIDRARSKMLSARHREAIRALQPKPPRPPRKCERPQMEGILEDSLARECPVPVREIAAQNGYANPGCIRLEFPDLCRAIGQKIAQRKKTEMNGKGEILKAALEEDPPPTAEQMAERLGFGCPGVLRRNFPAQYQALLEKRTAYEEAQRKQLRSDLISALAENPPPTVPAVCRRLGISTSRVYCLHGDLARAIAARHLKEQAESMERRRELLRIEVFAIVKDMLDRGERPVQARIRMMLSADSLKAWKTLGRFLNEVTYTRTMTETELVEEIKKLASDLSRRSTMWEHFHRVNAPENLRVMLELDAEARRRGSATGFPDPELPLAATAEAVNAAEQAVGFPFPSLLRRLWTEVGNGGFGPGYGLLGLEGGFGEEMQGMTTAELYLACLNAKWLPGPGGAPWPEKFVVICEWGCQNLTAVDCSTRQGQMVDLAEEDLYQPRHKGMTFSQWIEAWLKGEDLWPWDEAEDEEEDEV